MSKITLEKEIRIRDVSTLWKQIREMDDSVEIDCSALEKTDGAGFQLIVYLFKKGYVMKGLNEKMISSLDNMGFFVKGETVA